MDDRLKTIAVGIDVAQRSDWTAIAIVEHDEQPVPDRAGETETHYATRLLHRVDQGTSYPDIAKELVRAVERAVTERQRAMDALAKVELEWSETLPQERRKRAERLVSIYVDATGVGRPVVDIMRGALRDYACSLTAVTFVYGDKCDVHPGALESTLGKAHLVSRLQALFQTGRITLSRQHKLAGAMKDELLNYEIRVNENANEQFGAFRTGTHDDLVTALGLAVVVDPSAYRVTSLIKNW